MHKKKVYNFHKNIPRKTHTHTHTSFFPVIARTLYDILY